MSNQHFYKKIFPHDFTFCDLRQMWPKSPQTATEDLICRLLRPLWGCFGPVCHLQTPVRAYQGPSRASSLPVSSEGLQGLKGSIMAPLWGGHHPVVWLRSETKSMLVSYQLHLSSTAPGSGVCHQDPPLHGCCHRNPKHIINMDRGHVLHNALQFAY